MTRVVVGIIYKLNEQGEKEYLMVQAKRDYGIFSGYWAPPSGHVEKGEDDIDAIRREVKEETDLIITTVNKICETIGDLRELVVWFECQVENMDVKIKQDEISQFGFYKKQDLSSLPIWPATKTFFDNYNN